MSKNLILATAPVVRAAYREGKFTLPEGVSAASLVGAKGDGVVRGRIAPAAVQAFLDSPAGAGHKMPNLGNGGDRVTKPAATVEVPLVGTDAAGRKRTYKPVVLPVSEVRALAGKPESKGRVSKEMLTAAGAAVLAERAAKRKK
jgi:hypothetical protein